MSLQVYENHIYVYDEINLFVELIIRKRLVISFSLPKEC